MRYRKEKTGAISFPLGGIGSGCIGLAGNGALIDWEIFNRPAKNSWNGMSHFAVRAEENGEVVDFRILNGDLTPPYIGPGVGPSESSFAGWPHFREHEFTGAFPVAQLNFGGEKFPGIPVLTAWSVLIPGESKDSSLPGAFFEIELENNSPKTLDYTVIGVLSNPWENRNTLRYNRVEHGQLTMFSGDGTGDITLSLDEPEEKISHQTSFYRGGWRDSQERYYHDLMAGGRFRDRRYSTPPAKECSEPGLLAAHFRLGPGERKTVRFILTWSIPVYVKYWDPEPQHLKKSWLNYYATVWKDSRDSGNYAGKEYQRLRDKTFLFRDSLFSGSLPDSVKDAVSSCISVLKSPTCLRLEDGTFYGWEGVATDYGSCEGSCSHVWNYAQALPFLFPDLERSMRESHLKYSVDENGGSHFRLSLPLGVKASVSSFRPCADGQFGDVMKIYRDWKISGDGAFIRRWWQTIRKTVEYAWSDQNSDRWDPGQTGVLWGRQHHTLDMELFGPNAWLTGHYLGALDAAARMADFMEDGEFAARCRTLMDRGRKWVDENLFNGEYFCQKTELADPDIPKRFDAENYWNDESGEIKYQIADGCAIDAPLAQNYATLYGLGRIFRREKLVKTLQSIYRYNFKRSLRDEINVWRLFALNEEGGVVICTWPHGGKPAIPLTYNTEMMTGFEWAFASQLAAEGMVAEAFEVARAVRRRYDGERRNPWNEIECGNNYARSMAAYGLLPALAGFSYDRAAGRLGFAPKEPDFSGFWALGDVWGVFSQTPVGAKLEIRYGEFHLNELNLAFPVREMKKNNSPATLPVSLKAGDVLEMLPA